MRTALDTGIMTSNREFHFGLLRVSIIQLLKSHGFDRAKPSSVDTLTDLYTRYLGLLTVEIIKLAQSRMDLDDTIALQDITTAFQNLGIIKPVDVLDIYDENPELPSDSGVTKFKEWCLDNHQPKDARLVGLPTGDLLNINQRASKPLSLIPEYINQLQNDPQREKGSKENREQEKLIEELINNGDVDDWIRLIVARQRINLAKKITGKEPHDIKSLPSIAGFKHSVLNHQKYHGALILNNQLLPTPPTLSSEELSPALERGAELMKILPIMRPDWKLENLQLSYEKLSDAFEIQESDEDEDEIGGKVDEDQIDIPMNDNDVENDMGAFTLDPNMDTQFDELEDMNNTFQRRESLDFGDQTHQLRFGLDEF